MRWLVLATGLVCFAIAFNVWHQSKRHDDVKHVATPDAGEVALPPPVTPGDSLAQHAPPVAQVDASAARPAVPKKRTATSSPRTSRGALFTSMVATFVPPEQLPKALELIADTCDQERTLMDDADDHVVVDLNAGKKPDRDDDFQALKAVGDMQKDLLKSLSSLPGSTFDKKAWIALLRSKTYEDNCTRTKETDDEN